MTVTWLRSQTSQNVVYCPITVYWVVVRCLASCNDSIVEDVSLLDASTMSIVVRWWCAACRDPAHRYQWRVMVFFLTTNSCMIVDFNRSCYAHICASRISTCIFWYGQSHTRCRKSLNRLISLAWKILLGICERRSSGTLKRGVIP